MGEKRVVNNLVEGGTLRRVWGKNLLDEVLNGGRDDAVGREFIFIITNPPRNSELFSMDCKICGTYL